MALKDESEWLTLRLPVEHRAQLRRIAAEDGVSMSSIVRGVLELFLDDEREARRAKEARKRA
jgi:predicted DNA-binding protein